MGLITGTLRVHQLQDALHDMEFKVQEITQNKLEISHDLCEVADQAAMAAIEGKDSEVAKNLEAQKVELEAFEKVLDARMSQYNQKIQAIQQEMESAKKVVDYNIKSSFTYGGGQ